MIKITKTPLSLKCLAGRVAGRICHPDVLRTLPREVWKYFLRDQPQCFQIRFTGDQRDVCHYDNAELHGTSEYNKHWKPTWTTRRSKKIQIGTFKWQLHQERNGNANVFMKHGQIRYKTKMYYEGKLVEKEERFTIMYGMVVFIE